MAQKAVNLEELLALNAEIAGLIRAGMPLDLGLRNFATGASSGISQVSRRLAERVATGATLEQAIRDEGDHLPGVYVAVVEAGVRSGRLPDALEALSSITRELVDLHRRAVTAFLYPALVLVFAYVLVLIFLAGWVPVMSAEFTFKPVESGWIIRFLTTLREGMFWWGPMLPSAALVAFFWSGRSRTNAEGVGSLTSGTMRRFAWLPWMKRPIDDFDRGLFSMLLGLLVRHETPLADALLIASFASGNAELVAGSTRLADEVRAGNSLGMSLPLIGQFPSFFRTMLALGERHQSLPATLQRTSEVYRQRADRGVEFARVALPVLLTVVLGGFAAGSYAFVVFGPMVELYGQIANPKAAP